MGQCRGKTQRVKNRKRAKLGRKGGGATRFSTRTKEKSWEVWRTGTNIRKKKRRGGGGRKSNKRVGFRTLAKALWWKKNNKITEIEWTESGKKENQSIIRKIHKTKGKEKNKTGRRKKGKFSIGHPLKTWNQGG